MISIKALYYGIAKAVSGICDKGYYQDRPTSVADRPDSYIVVHFPSSIYNNEIGQNGEYRDFDTTVQLEVYVRDKMSSENPIGIDVSTMDAKVKDVLSRFPISTSDFSVTRPMITLQTNDDSGFHVTIIQGRLKTK